MKSLPTLIHYSPYVAVVECAPKLCSAKQAPTISQSSARSKFSVKKIAPLPP